MKGLADESLVGLIHHAVCISTYIQEDRLLPEPQSYTALMSACHRAGESQHVLDLLREMENIGIEAQVSAYVTAIHAAIADKQYDEMLEVGR